MCEELKLNPIFLALFKLQFDLLKLSAICTLGWFKRPCWCVCFIYLFIFCRLKPYRPERASGTAVFRFNTCSKYAGFLCMHVHMHQNLHLCVFWSGLIFPSILIPWREEWSEAGVVIRGIDHRHLSWWGRLGAEVREQVEVWILLFREQKKKAKPAHCRSIFSPMVTALEREDVDRLIISSLSQNRLKWGSTELSGVPCTWISVLISSYVLAY